MSGTRATGDRPLIPLGVRPAGLLTLVSAVGFVAYCWPFVVTPGAALDNSHSADAPWFFVILLPLLAAVVVAEISAGGIDAKTVAMLGMLVAIGAAMRALGPGFAGLEPSFVVIVLGSRVFGRGFGFVLGALTIFAGALITGGVGPWLPFQMFGAGWVGLFAGMLPRAGGRREVVILACYGLVAGLVYGALLNLWFWPFAAYSPEVQVRRRGAGQRQPAPLPCLLGDDVTRMGHPAGAAHRWRHPRRRTAHPACPPSYVEAGALRPRGRTVTRVGGGERMTRQGPADHGVRRVRRCPHRA